MASLSASSSKIRDEYVHKGVFHTVGRALVSSMFALPRIVNLRAAGEIFTPRMRRFELALQAPQARTLPSYAEWCSSTLRRPSGLKGQL